MGTTTKNEMKKLISKVHELQLKKPDTVKMNVDCGDRYVFVSVHTTSETPFEQEIYLNLYDFLSYKENQRELNGFIIAFEDMAERLSSIHRIV